MKEIWKLIPGISGYEASTLGRIRSLDRYVTRSAGNKMAIKGKILSPWLTPDYDRYRIELNGKQYFVSRIVCLTFNGPSPYTNGECDHIDGDRKNNKPDNLQWLTPEEHYLKTMKQFNDIGLDSPIITAAKRSAKVNAKKVKLRHIESGTVYHFPSGGEASRILGIKKENVSQLRTGKRKKIRGFRYVD